MIEVGCVVNMHSLCVVAHMKQSIQAVPCRPQYRRSWWLQLSWPSVLVALTTADHSRLACSFIVESPVDDTVGVVGEAPC